MYVCIKLNFHYRITDNSNNVGCNRLIPKIRLYFKFYKCINSKNYTFNVYRIIEVIILQDL